MADNTIRLTADLDTQPAEKSLGKLEQKTDKTTKEMSKDFKKVGTDAEKAGKKAERSFTDAGQTGAKAAGIAGAGFAGIAGGIGVATASAESFEASMIGASSAIVSGFAAGGPVGAAVAGVGVGLGFLVKALKEVDTEADKAAEALAQIHLESKENLDKTVQTVADLRDVLRGLHQGRSAAEIKAERERLEAMEKSLALVMDLREQQRKQQEELQQITSTAFDPIAASRAVRAEIAGTAIEIGKAQEKYDQLVAASAAFDDAQAGIARHAQDIADKTEAAADEAARLAENVGAMAGPAEALEADMTGIWKALTGSADAAGLWVGPLEAIEVNIVKILDDFKRAQDTIDMGNQSLDRQLQLLRATEGAERDRVRLAQERQDLLDKGLDVAKVEELHALKLAELAEDEADAKERSAKSSEKSAAAISKAAKAAKSSAAGFSDVTKGFQGIGGGTFGFGAKPAGPTSFFSPEVFSAGTKSPAAASMDKAAQEVAKAKQASKSTDDSAAKLAKAVKEMADQTVETVQTILDEFGGSITLLNARTVQMQSILNAAGNFGIGGS